MFPRIHTATALVAALATTALAQQPPGLPIFPSQPAARDAAILTPIRL